MSAMRPLLAMLAGAALAGCAIVSDAESGPAKRHMIAAANPLAAKAGLEILRAGGSAVDAAITIQLVLGLVEPQSSGIGGGAFLLHYDGAKKKVDAYDGRETAPASIDPDIFLLPDGTPRPFLDAVVGGQSVGVPGVMAMLALAHADHGKLPWAAAFAPAIALAEDGFDISARLHRLIGLAKHLADFRAARGYFFDREGKPKAIGERLRNPDYAATLRLIAKGGARAFYHGQIAASIAAAVWSAGTNPGRLTRGDLAAYRAVKRAPLCRPYRTWNVCGMPPPTSGGVAVLQILGMLERFDMPGIVPGSVQAVHLISEASRLAFVDRWVYLADPDFADIPVKGLLARDYLAERAAAIAPDRVMKGVVPGTPADNAKKPDTDKPRKKAGLIGAASPELPSTSHFSLVDGDGNAVSMTTSIENIFGSRLMVRGFMLNNQLTDFSFTPTRGETAVANRVQPGKRPRSSMAPMLVFGPKGELRFALGSPGGTRIIPYVAKTLVGVLDWMLPIDAAISLPNHANRNGPTELEADTPLAAIAPALQALGHQVRIGRLSSGLHGIEITPDGLEGGADPRREGVAMGE